MSAVDLWIVYSTMLAVIVVPALVGVVIVLMDGGRDGE